MDRSKCKITTSKYWVMHNSKFWSILFFAFRFNLNMSQNPDSMQSPELVSDFDADAWFVRNRRQKSGQPPVTRARGPRAVATPARAGRGRKSNCRNFFLEILLWWRPFVYGIEGNSDRCAVSIENHIAKIVLARPE